MVSQSMSAVVPEGTSSLAEVEADLAPSAGEDTSWMASAASVGQEQGVLRRNQERPLTVAGLAGEFEVVAGEPVVAIAVREVLEAMAEKTQSPRQTLRAQQSRCQAWEVCMLAGAE